MKAIALQMALWEPASLPAADTRLAGVLRVKRGKEDEGGRASERLQILPVTSKDGPSVKSVTGLSGVTLKAQTRMYKDELKNWLVQQAVKMQGDSHFTGGSLSVSKTGNRVSLVFTRCEGITVEKATEQELCERLGITPEQVKALRDAQGGEKEPVDNGHNNGELTLEPEGDEPTPAPAPKAKAKNTVKAK